MKREAPTESDITDLIAKAFEQLPEPDSRRLASIEQRLLEQPRLRKRTKNLWWWLAAMLVAGAASALWWAVGYDSGKGREAPVPAAMPSSIAPSAADQPIRPGQSESAESKPAGESPQKSRLMIYRKEQ